MLIFLFLLKRYVDISLPSELLSNQIGNRGTVTEAAGFDADADAQRLRGAMKGAGE